MGLQELQKVTGPAGAMVQRGSGILVPEAVADATPDASVPRDPDGRRRVVLPRDAQKKINAAIQELKAAGLGIVVGCRFECGQPLLNEGVSVDPATGARTMSPDAGYGCKCTRVHFR